MYVPAKFSPPSAEAVESFIRENGFASLVSLNDRELIATHTPVMLELTDDSEFLIGHISVANKQKASFNGQTPLLAIFIEQHSYISSSWYSHINVPTWNYIAVHISGTAEVMEGEDLVRQLHSLVDKYEKNNTKPFEISQMPDDMFQKELKGIVGFKMKIEKVQASYKLSQNRNDADHESIIKHLEKRGDEFSRKIAQDMRDIRSSK